MRRMTAISLFAGVGGIDLAMQRSGVQVTAAVEIDKAARGVLADRFPETTLFPDVTKVTADELRATGFVPDRGIITAGWPCQGNSVAGVRGGMADPRSGLWRHVVRLLAELRARWFLGENVPGLLSVTDGEDFGIVLQDLADLGMGFAYRVMDAQFFGVPQRRRRVFVVGCLGDSGAAPVQVLLEPEGGGGNSPQSRTAGQGVAATLTAGVARAGVSAPGRRQEDDVNLVPTLTARYAKGTDSDATDAMIVGTLTSSAGGCGESAQTKRQRATSSSREVVMALTSSGVGTCGPDDNQAQAGHLVLSVAENQRGEVVTGAVTQALSSGGGKPGQGYPCVAISATGSTHTLTSEGADASEDGTGRGTPVIAFAWQAGGNETSSGAFDEDLTPTLPKSQTLAVQTETIVRRLTPMECERLQGFPDGWSETSNGKPQADSARYRQMGNSVAVPCLEWIVGRIVALDGAA